MIDIEKIDKMFDEYVSNYDPSNGRIMLKIEHIKRVADNSKVIAENLNLSKEDVDLAIAIGYFHDIGRFEQVRIANTFSDKESKINHAEMSVKVLFENDKIRDFISTTEYDEIIKKAVLNHNKLQIEDGLTDRELLFAKIIRDADKLDIFYIIANERYSMESIFWYDKWDDQKIDEDLLIDFKKTRLVHYSRLKNNADVIIAFYGYIFDLYFDITKKIVKENNYLEVFTNRVLNKFESNKVHSQTEELLKDVEEYLKSL